MVTLKKGLSKQKQQLTKIILIIMASKEQKKLEKLGKKERTI
jgi:hypothetical protein